MTIEAVAHALADPTRREILRLVEDRRMAVVDIAANFDVSRPAISQHLRVLTDAELVTVQASGNRRLYRARPEGVAELRQWMEGFWRRSLASLKVEVERELWNDRKDAHQERNEP